MPLKAALWCSIKKMAGSWFDAGALTSTMHPHMGSPDVRSRPVTGIVSAAAKRATSSLIVEMLGCVSPASPSVTSHINAPLRQHNPFVTHHPPPPSSPPQHHPTPQPKPSPQPNQPTPHPFLNHIQKSPTRPPSPPSQVQQPNLPPSQNPFFQHQHLLLTFH